MRLKNVRIRFKNIKVRLENVKVRFKNMKLQKSFSEVDKVKHLQLDLFDPYNR